MRRKCVILHNSHASKVPLVMYTNVSRRLGRDAFDRTAQFEAFKDLLRTNGVEITNQVRHHGAVFGWVEQDQIQAIRDLEEVAAINDDYAYLVQDPAPSTGSTAGTSNPGAAGFDSQ